MIWLIGAILLEKRKSLTTDNSLKKREKDIKTEKTKVRVFPSAFIQE